VPDDLASRDNSRASYRIEKLTADHHVAQFDCGRASLDDWLRRFALINQRSDSARTYVLVSGQEVFGYYSLTAGSVAREEATERVAKGLARHRIGVVLLARLAVDRSRQGKALGKALLFDALRRVLQVADTVGVRATLVNALDQEAAMFYERQGFERSPLDPQQLMMLTKDLRAAVEALGQRFI
jgi:GNAT superfamily N-acetyltransferase